MYYWDIYLNLFVPLCFKCSLFVRAVTYHLLPLPFPNITTNINSRGPKIFTKQLLVPLQEWKQQIWITVQIYIHIYIYIYIYITEKGIYNNRHTSCTPIDLYTNNPYQLDGRCPWCNGYRRRKWTRRHEFKSWTRLIAFHIALIPLGKVWIHLFSLQMWANSRADWVLQPWCGN